jgi:Holliday junction resolvase RusA-like endonuclease
MEPQVITFEIPGNPQALKRHRSYRMGEGLRMVDPSAQDKDNFLLVSMSHKPPTPFNEALHVGCTFVFPRPKGHYGTGKNAKLLKPSAPYFHTGKPDGDNLFKFIGDALEGIFWLNDSCIVKPEALKVYANDGRPRTIITIQPAVPGNPNWREVVNEIYQQA